MFALAWTAPSIVSRASVLGRPRLDLEQTVKLVFGANPNTPSMLLTSLSVTGAVVRLPEDLRSYHAWRCNVACGATA
jgi:hypothetical protein